MGAAEQCLPMHSGLASLGPMSPSSGSNPVRSPERTCIACSAKVARSALTRIAAAPGGVRLDLKGRLPGRGAYLCRRRECDKALMRAGRLSYALRTTVSESEMSRLISEMKARAEPQGSTETN